MILGFPDEIFFILAYSGIATTTAVLFAVLYFLVPPTGKKLLKARLARRKPAVVFEFYKASLNSALAKSFGPGWIETDEGKRYITPIPPVGKEGEWNPERDILGKLCLLDGMFPCYITYETTIFASNPELLGCLEAYVKGYGENKQIPVSPNPELKAAIPVSPKVIAETIRSFLSTEHVDQLEERIIEAEVKRRAKGEWGPIIKVALILGMIFVAGLIVLLVAKSALGM